MTVGHPRSLLDCGQLVDRRLKYGRDIVEDYLNSIAPYETVMDIGAGEGVDLKAALKICPRADAIAVGGQSSFLERLVQFGITTYNIDLEHDKLPRTDESVDVLISNQTLEHMKEIFWIFHEISRVLRFGGYLILGVPNLAAVHNRILLALGRQPSVIRTISAHMRGFTKRDILLFLDSAFPKGYVSIAHRRANFYPFPPVLAKPLPILFPNLAWGTFLLLRKVGFYHSQFLQFPKAMALETPFFVGRYDG